MKKVRIACLLIALGIVLWSIITDITTYNVYFQTDKNIVLYCIDGIIFNAPKLMLPIVIAITTFIYDYAIEKKLITTSTKENEQENRIDRC